MSSTTSHPPVPGDARERGQILVLFAGGLIALLLIAALAFDVGMMLVERRDEQNAADAAALAGARYVLTDQAAAETAARDIAQMNGFVDADPNEVVNVYIPPIHGRYVNLPGFIEVQIQVDPAIDLRWRHRSRELADRCLRCRDQQPEPDVPVRDARVEPDDVQSDRRSPALAS